MRHTLYLLTPLLAASLCACGTPRHLSRAKAQLARGDYEGAETGITPHLTQNPDDDQLAGLAMRALFARARAQDAIALFRRRPNAERRRQLALARLWAAMRDRDPRIRLAAVQSARRINAHPLAPEMVRRLMDPDPLVKTWAAVALSGAPQGAELLGQQLKAPQQAARVIAIREVGRLAGKGAPAQLRAFVNDAASEIREACAVGLAHGEAATAKKMLLELAADADREVRIAAYRAIARLGIESGIPLLEKGVSGESKGERRAALLAYGKLTPPERGRALCQRIAKGDEIGLALVAGRQLAKWGEVQPVLDTIAGALLSRRHTLRAAAVNAASGVSDPVAYELAKKALRDPEPRVRLAAIALAQSKGRDLKLAREAAATTFAQLCPKPQAPCLEAARLLAAAGDARGVGSLRRLARMAKTWKLRATALRQLLRYGATQQDLLEAFTDGDVRVALVAAEQIWRR